MPEVLAIVAVLGVVAATAAAGVALFRLGSVRREAAMGLVRAETRYAEVVRLHRAEQQLADMQRLTEAAVAGGTQVVRTVHQGIAAIPFSILESIPATRDTTRVVRQTHDLIAGTVYGTIGAVNKGIGSLLRSGMTPPPTSGNESLPREPGAGAEPKGRPPDKE